MLYPASPQQDTLNENALEVARSALSILHDAQNTQTTTVTIATILTCIGYLFALCVPTAIVIAFVYLNSEKADKTG